MSQPKILNESREAGTPRTDHAMFRFLYRGDDNAVSKLCRRLERELAEWKENFVAFGGAHIAAYGKERYGERCLHYTHYDLLKAAGARMDDFIRSGESAGKTEPNAARNDNSPGARSD